MNSCIKDYIYRDESSSPVLNFVCLSNIKTSLKNSQCQRQVIPEMHKRWSNYMVIIDPSSTRIYHVLSANHHHHSR